MNERIDQLLVKAGAYFGGEGVDYSNFDPKKFAELIVLECMYVGRLAQINNQLVDSEIKDHFGVEETSIKIGSRIKVISGFNVGAKGTVSYIEPSGKLWVRRDRASSDVFYHPEEVIGVDE